MKSATLPSLRVEPESREAVEQILADGETVSGFIEGSIRAQVALRRVRAEFLRRGLTALANFERTGESVPAETVLRKLGGPLLRELLIPFGSSGYVTLYRILDDRRVLVLALRHQLEDDYH